VAVVGVAAGYLQLPVTFAHRWYAWTLTERVARWYECLCVRVWRVSPSRFDSSSVPRIVHIDFILTVPCESTSCTCPCPPQLIYLLSSLQDKTHWNRHRLLRSETGDSEGEEDRPSKLQNVSYEDTGTSTRGLHKEEHGARQEDQGVVQQGHSRHHL
jgi:hypothetical protein